MDRLEAMSVFLSVVALGSFSAASRRLSIPLPTVSRRISELESHLNAKLLARSTRKLALTEVGKSYATACQRILEEVAEAERNASGQYDAPQGELIVTAPIVFGRLHVVPVTTEFLKAHARVDVRLVLTDRPLNLIDDQLDLALRIGPLPDSRLVAIRVGQMRSVVCASPAYLRKRGVPKSPEQLTSHDCITFAALAGVDTWTFRANQSVRVRSRMIVSTAEAAVDAAIAGIGLTRVLAYQVAHAITSGMLVIVLKKFEPTALPVNLIYVKETRLTAKLRGFIDFATPRLRDRLKSVASDVA